MSAPDRVFDQALCLVEVERYRVLGARPERDVDDLVSLAALACNAPMALVAIGSGDTLSYVSTFGISASQLADRPPLWGQSLDERDVIVVADAMAHVSLATDKRPTASPHVRAFAAIPLLTGCGIAVGKLCVADRDARAFSARQVSALQVVSRQIMALLESREHADGVRATEDRLITAFRNSPVPVTIMRWADRVLVDVNPSFTALFGWTPEDVVGRTNTDLHFIDEAESVKLRSLLQSSELRGQEVEVRTRDGEPRQVIVGAALVEMLGERHAITTFVDISGRNGAVERRRPGQERYRALFDYAPYGILIANAEGEYLDANPSICTMLGYGRDELIGMSGADIVSPAEYQYIEPALTAINTSPEYRREWIFRRKDGTTFRADVIATLMPDGKVLAMIRDITERSRADARFRRLVESNAQGVLFWSATNEIADANDAFLRIVGYERDDVAAKRITLGGLTPPEYSHLDRRARGELATRGVCTPYEKEFVRKNGTRVPVVVGAAVFEDDPQEGVCFVLDLTEFKRLEQQLLRAQRMESIGTLAGGIAHDLNNVLAPIMLSVELLKDMVDDDEVHSILDTMEASARHGADLVQQVVTFARGVEGQRIVMNPELPLRELFKVLRDTFPKTVDPQLTVAPELWSITGDATQIHQVFLNLCVNARDAMPHGGTLSVAMANVVLDETFASMNLDAHAGDYVVITVSDTGTGMSASVQERIFEPFFTTKDTGQGTGLGLSTSIAIVKGHGGFIHVNSEPNVGTTFHVYLPASTGRARSEDADAGRSRHPRGNGELILVVDDEEALRVIVKGTLERHGYRVLLASNGAEAVRLYALHRTAIAAVLTDMAMPVMDGAQAIAALMAIDPSVRIIGSSGLTDSVGIRRAMGAGVRQFVHKPYSAEVILTLLRHVIDAAPDAHPS